MSIITSLALYDLLTHPLQPDAAGRFAASGTGKSQTHNLKVAPGFIDLDHFKQINDTFGFAHGWQIRFWLIYPAIRSAGRDIDTPQMGGDLLLLIPDTP